MSDQQSKALTYVQQRWPGAHRDTGDQLVIQSCPYCACPEWKLYINKSTFLWMCQKCKETGNEGKLKQKMGDRVAGYTEFSSAHDVIQSTAKPEPLPDMEKHHAALLADDAAMNYLNDERGIGYDIVVRMKLGLGPRKMGDVLYERCLMFPYYVKGALAFVKWRTLPPDHKDFRSTVNRPAPLYNGDAITKEMEELIMCEGETDTLACLTNGIDNVVGVPGADGKKLLWLDKIDNAKPKRIYMLYDNDPVGQKGAYAMAIRIGLDKNIFSIVLPQETLYDENCEKCSGTGIAPAAPTLAIGEQLDGGPCTCGKQIKDINEWFKAGHTIAEFDQLKDDAKMFNVDGITPMADAISELEMELEEKGNLLPQYITPWRELNLKFGGASDGDVVGILAEGKVGKDQPLSARILTPQGFSTMGDMQVGTPLASVDGEPSFVTGVFPQGYKTVYTLKLSDGRSTHAGEEHLWMVGSVTNFGRDGYRKVTTLELKSLVERGADEFFIPLFSGEFGTDDSSLPLDPWLLGAIIGDGSLSSGNCSFTKADEGVVDAVNMRLNLYGCELNQIDAINYRIVGIERGNNAVREALRQCAVLGCKSIEKAIPVAYMNSDRQSRLSLLRGLMDTDGSLEGAYKVPCFNTSSERLANQVVMLVRSLGGIAEVTNRVTSYVYKGHKRQGKRSYRVLVKLNHDSCFEFSYKASAERLRSREARLRVVSVEYLGKEQCQCISVSHPSKLYVTDDFVVTHNTTLVMNWLDYLVGECEIPSMLFCLEMRPSRLARKWCSYITRTDDTPFVSPFSLDKDFAKQVFRDSRAIMQTRKADFLWGYKRLRHIEEAYEVIYQTVRRYGVKAVGFDNLQLAADQTLSKENRTVHLSQVSKGLKAIAMELKVMIPLLIQPNRVAEGTIAAARNADGASQIEKDVDALVCAHRQREGVMKQKDLDKFGSMDLDRNFSPIMYLRTDLSRFAPGGTCRLWMDGAKSWVRDITPEDLLGVPATEFNNTGVTVFAPAEMETA